MNQIVKQKSIWEYMNSANLITIDDINDKEKIKNIEKLQIKVK